MPTPAERTAIGRLPQGVKLAEVALDNTLSYPSGGAGIVQELPVGTIPRDLPLAGLLARFRYRLSVTAAATAVNADGPLAICRHIRLTGDSKTFGTGIEIWPTVPAPVIDAYNRLSFKWTPFNVGQAISAAVGTYDVDASLFIPTSLPQSTDPVDFAESMLNGPDWTALNLYVDWGGVADLLNGGTATLSAYGQSTGSPAASFTAIQARLGLGVAKYRPFLVTRRWINLGSPAGAGTRFQLYPNLPIGKAYLDFVVKTYLASAAGSTDIAQSLDDGDFVSRIYLGTQSKDFLKVDWTAEQALVENFYRKNLAHVPGYVMKDWGGPHGDPEAALPTQLYAASGKQLNLYGDVQTGFSTHTIGILASMIQGAPA
jgi:hypothetical protein